MERFRIISKLGAGGFGEAFRAWDNQAGVPVVLKRPLEQYLNSPAMLERFDREINRLSDLVHQHIVPIVDHGHDAKGLPYLAMRFLPAGSLANRKKPQALSYLHFWLPPVGAALDYVHAHGIVHRDVKPANIFFDTHFRAYLGDFGIAKVIDEELANASEHSLTIMGGEIGTYPYMGPEFFRKPRILSGAYDQYALAITVYEMICGQRPFSGDIGQLILAHATQDPPDIRETVSDAPESLCQAVSRALAKKPADRFASCTAFADAALRDVATVALNDAIRYFLCPACMKLVRVPTDAGGQSCRCTRCQATLRISENMDALWRAEEAPSTIRTPQRQAIRADKKSHTSSPRNSGRVKGESLFTTPFSAKGVLVPAVSLLVAFVLRPGGDLARNLPALPRAACTLASGLAILTALVTVVRGVLSFALPRNSEPRLLGVPRKKSTPIDSPAGSPPDSRRLKELPPRDGVRDEHTQAEDAGRSNYHTTSTTVDPGLPPATDVDEAPESLLKKCPHCPQSFAIGNPEHPFFWLGYHAIWSDGCATPRGSPWLVKCPYCSRLVWCEESAENPQFVPTSISPVSGDGAKSCLMPSEMDCLAAIDTPLCDSPAKAKHIRTIAWWAANDRFRGDDFGESIVSDEACRNMECLFAMLSENDDDERLMKAELARELGRFDEAERLLATEFTNVSEEKIAYLQKLTSDGDRRVAKVDELFLD